jgi:hypothetical protein
MAHYRSARSQWVRNQVKSVHRRGKERVPAVFAARPVMGDDAYRLSAALGDSRL